MSDSEQILPESTAIQSDSNQDDLNKVPENHIETSNDSSSTTSSQTYILSSSHSMELEVSPRKRQTARKHTSSHLIFSRENYYLTLASQTSSRSVRQTARKSTSPPFCRIVTPTARKQAKKAEQYQIQKQTARKLVSSNFRPVISGGPRIEIDTADDFEPSILNDDDNSDEIDKKSDEFINTNRMIVRLSNTRQTARKKTNRF